MDRPWNVLEFTNRFEKCLSADSVVIVEICVIKFVFVQNRSMVLIYGGVKNKFISHLSYVNSMFDRVIKYLRMLL